MRTSTFEVHFITPTSPSIHVCNLYKVFCFFLLLFFFTCFSFKQIMHEHIRDRKEIPNYVKHLTFQFCYTETHRCHWHCTFAMPKHTDVILWLTGNNGQIVIYAFLLGFSSPSCKKSDTSVKYKKLLNLTHHKYEP